MQNITITKNLHGHPYSNAMFFSFTATVTEKDTVIGSVTTAWLSFDTDSNTLVDTEHGINIEQFDHEHIFTSKAVHLHSSPLDELEVHKSEINELFSKGITKHVGFNIPLPALSTERDIEEVIYLKNKKGYAYVEGGFFPKPK
jgi:hypothetical protein